jgi:hypothetical protein
MDLLTAYTHDSELQAITTPLLISTIQKSPQHPLSLFQSAVFTSRSLATVLTVEILQLDALKASVHRLPYITHTVAPAVFKITPRHGPRRNIPFPLFLHVDSLIWIVFTEPLPRNGSSICLSSSRRIATALHARIHFI